MEKRELVRFDKVRKTFIGADGNPVDAVKDLSFTLSSGECCCLLGPNGAGKTTSIMMLLGFTPISSGDIIVAGASVSTATAQARARISYIPDEVALYRNLSGLKNMQFFDKLLGKKHPPQHYLDLGARVGLGEPAMRRKLSTYSKGMKQRLAIAVALLKEADVFVLDEPTTGLDAIGIRELFEVIRELRGLGKAIVVTTHDLMHVSDFADRVLFLLDGSIRKELQASDIAAGVDVEQTYVDLIQAGSATRGVQQQRAAAAAT